MLNKLIGFVLLLSVCILCACEGQTGEENTAPVSTTVKEEALSGRNIRICSYNMLFEKTTPAEANKRWVNRVKVITGIMDDYNLDIVGSQEALTWQVNSITKQGKYDKVGWDIAGKTNALNNENDALFFLKSRFEVVDVGQFWYSQTPETPNTWAWDATYARACTWARFREIPTGIEFYVFNTHLHHPNDNPIAHYNEVRLLVSQSQSINSERLPMFYTGDFNSTPDLSGILYITSMGMSDSRQMATSTVGRIPTYHNFNVDRSYGWRLDFIFVNDRVKVGKYRCEDSELISQKWGSDHHPIMIDAELK